MTVKNCSLTSYKQLQDLYPNTLKCPCSNVTVPYSEFISLSLTLHQVCSSDFVSDSWILMMKLVRSDKWYGLTAQHFRLLSNLCRMTKKTIDDAVRRLTIRHFLTLNVPTESSFNTELNTTLNQFIQTLIINFDLLVNTSHLWTQIDEPFTVPYAVFVPPNVDSVLTFTANQSSNQRLAEVCRHLRERTALSTLQEASLFSWLNVSPKREKFRAYGVVKIFLETFSGVLLFAPSFLKEERPNKRSKTSKIDGIFDLTIIFKGLKISVIIRE